MGLGFSFGKNDKKTSSVSNVDQTQTGSQSGTEFTLGQTTSSTNQTSQGTNTSSGTSTTSQSQNQQGSTTTTGTQQGRQSSFTDPVAQAIESTILGLAGSAAGASGVVESGVAGLQNFDPNAFVTGIVQQANAKQNMQLEQALNGLNNASGGTVGSNSMSALLAQRLAGDAAANTAGIQASATGTAQDILRQNLTSSAGAMSSVTNLLPAIIDAFKGGNVTSEQTNVAQELANLLNTTTGSTSTSEQSAQSQSQQSETVQNVLQLIAQAMTNQTHLVGTETTKGKESKTGGGISLGI